MSDFIHKLFTSFKVASDGDTRIGELNRIWYDSISNTFRIQLDDAPGGTIIGGSGGGSSYTLPTATTSIKGGVKIDGTTITISNQVISIGTVPYSSLSGAPAVPTNTNELTNGAGFITASALTNYALASSVPTNTNQLTNGAGYTTCTGSMSNWYWGITGSTTTISNGETVCLVAGSNVTLSRSGNAVTINASSGGTVYNCQITFNAGTGLTTSIGANDYIELNQSYNETISYSLTSSCQTAIANGSTAYGWGNHASAGYCTTDTNCTYSLYQYSNRARLHESPSNSVWDVTFGAGTGMSVSGSGGTITYTNSCPSDYRLKTCVESYVDAYDIVKGVEAYKYILIDDKDQKEETGLIAHELQEVLPNAVIGEKDAVNDEGEPVYQEVVYSGLVPTLWSALRKSIQKIEVLEEINNTLIDRITKLEQAVGI